MPQPETGATQYHAQLGLPDKGHAIKRLVVCNNWDREPFDLPNGLALGCYQPSPEVEGLVPRNAFDLKLVTHVFFLNDLNYIYKVII